ncbi:hypothetical protein [Halegenticoccus tardaugens]|uniref:hypothetical protein n=1 Tax=Halegenticoccus tardaugens TaxID=2071624 RepID=UPI00100B8EE3|nr:hypothetical protein [Halegenticoccus tardaugens]
MRRRALLSAFPAAVVPAGCLDRAAVAGDGASRSSEAPSENGTSAGGDVSIPDDYAEPGLEFEPDDDGDPVAEWSVGTRPRLAELRDDRPHAVRIWNAADEEREVAVRIRRDGDGTVADDEVTLPADADACLSVALERPADHAVVVFEAGSEPTETVYVGRSLFDCNYSATDVGVHDDGSLSWSTVSTTMGCG